MKDNNEFGSVYWLCGNNNVAKSLKYAYNEIGGTGFCKCYLQEFTIPYPEF